MTQRTGQLLDHTGQLLEDDREFSEAAPPGIGRVLSAFSTLRHGQLRSVEQRSAIWAGISALPLILGSVALLVAGPERLGENASGLWTLVGICGGLMTLLGVGNLRFHECNYVGEKGIARFHFPGFKLGVTATNNGVLLFETARVLYSNLVRTHYNGIYGGTTATFTWRDQDGKILFLLTSSYYSWKERPHRDRTVHLGRAAERAWTAWVVERHKEELEKSGKTGFPFESGGGIFLTRHGLTVRQGQKDTEFPQGSLTGLSVQNGQLCLHREGEKGGIFGKGPFTLNYAQLGNAQAFLALATEQLRIPLLSSK